MSTDPLRFAAFCAYLAAWIAFAVGALVGAIPRIREQAVSPPVLNARIVVGTFLQIAAALMITLSLRDDPLRPTRIELIGILTLAPFAAALFIGALLSAPRDSGPHRLATRGAYAWMRHPIYLAFLAMLVASGLLISARSVLAIAVVLYLAGSELRIAFEEEELAGTFRAEYEQYRLRTRWRYFPGLR